jgi:RNA 2',3'-cyclic 3'-phosphodiesterase
VSAAPVHRTRLFAALELPAEARRALEAFRVRAADPEVWRPVPTASLHVTLAFLGPTDDELVDPVAAALEAAAGPAPRLALDGALLLPPRRPRVLGADVADPDGTLAALQARVSDALAATGAYAPEGRPFRAHVTVARLRPRRHAPRTPPAGPEPVAFTATAFSLYASRLHPGGARYESLNRVMLRPT